MGIYDQVVQDINEVQLRAEDAAQKRYIEAVTPKIKRMILDRLIESSGVAAAPGSTTPPASEDKNDDKQILGDSVSPSGADELVEAGTPDLETESLRVCEESRNLLAPACKLREMRSYSSIVERKLVQVGAIYESAVKAKCSAAVINRLDNTKKSLSEAIKKMTTKNSTGINEDLTLTLTGLDDVDIDDVGVELEEGGDTDDVDIDLDDNEVPEEPNDGGDDVNDDLDVDPDGAAGADGAPDASAPQEPAEQPAAPAPAPAPTKDPKNEGRRSSKNDVMLEFDDVELAEGLKSLQERRRPGEAAAERRHPRQTPEKKHPSSILSQFGGGADQGDPWLDGPDCDTDDCEPLRKQLKHQQSLLAQSKKNNKAGAVKVCESRIRTLTQSIERHKKLNENAAPGRTTAGNGSNSRSTRHSLDESSEKLRAQLNKVQLNNVKLFSAAKLLRTGVVTQEGFDKAVRQLEAAKNEVEVKRIYESIEKANKKRLDESRRPRGSASAPVTSGAPTEQRIDEHTNVSRWAQLAGISLND